MSIYIGTSGYSYPHWKGVFYPQELSQSKWLEHYSKFFSTVELNVTFYRLPQESAFLSWYKKTPKDFTFVIKGSRYITHVKKINNIKDPVKLFFSRVKLLKEKLKVVLWQLPPTLKANPKRLEEFLKIVISCPSSVVSCRHAFEFRNESWFNKETYKILKKYNAALVIADSPQLRPLSFAGQAPYPLTADFVYIRFHGGRVLYGSEYSSKELKEWAKKIKNWSKRRDIFIYFNNDAYGFAVKNALELKKILKI